ncbi:hypothetical protein [Haloterrigena alkaliphila]|uniref:Fido domain-containing protein n=1 Tax=Haloterrigena alkaliphila TaxID=2816475 RepID=A0A8A2V8H5_9EURY|nr:hypothetical protein [Haloterrigena alkaliphila]QSW98203.1 hypothetical protein J0X25_12395 [Haloterrigena alkaliphila]
MSPTAGDHSYRDFIDVQQPMYRSDTELLDELTEGDRNTPYELANGRYRENVIRLQLKDLRRLGLARRAGHEFYEITEYGEDVLRDAEPLPLSNGLFDVEAIVPEKYPSDEWRIQDFSEIDGPTIKRINYDIIEDSTEVYGWVRDSPERTRTRIRGVADTDIHRLIREFPTHDPLPAQCAHWVRAFTGLHFFPDANHRTATNTLEYIVEQNGGPATDLIRPEIRRVVLLSKYTRTLKTDNRFNTLWERDEHFYLWYRYFTRALTDQLERRRPDDPPTELLDSCLQDIRGRLAEFGE